MSVSSRQSDSGRSPAPKAAVAHGRRLLERYRSSPQDPRRTSHSRMRSPSPVPAPAALDPRRDPRHRDDEEEEVGAPRQPSDPLTQRERDDMNSLVNKRMTVAVEASRPRQPDLPRPPISSYLRDIGSSPFVDSKIAMEESRMREMKQHMQWRTEVETLQRQQQQLETDLLSRSDALREAVLEVVRTQAHRTKLEAQNGELRMALQQAHAMIADTRVAEGSVHHQLQAANNEITQLQTLLAESNRLNGALMMQVKSLHFRSHQYSANGDGPQFPGSPSNPVVQVQFEDPGASAPKAAAEVETPGRNGAAAKAAGDGAGGGGGGMERTGSSAKLDRKSSGRSISPASNARMAMLDQAFGSGPGQKPETPQHDSENQQPKDSNQGSKRNQRQSPDLHEQERRGIFGNGNGNGSANGSPESRAAPNGGFRPTNGQAQGPYFVPNGGSQNDAWRHVMTDTMVLASPHMDSLHRSFRVASPSYGSPPGHGEYSGAFNRHMPNQAQFSPDPGLEDTVKRQNLQIQELQECLSAMRVAID